jgi:hypothetical protein
MIDDVRMLCAGGSAEQGLVAPVLAESVNQGQPIDTVTPTTYRMCSSCKRSLPKKFFSNSQLKKKAAQSTCQQCMLPHLQALLGDDHYNHYHNLDSHAEACDSPAEAGDSPPAKEMRYLTRPPQNATSLKLSLPHCPNDARRSNLTAPPPTPLSPPPVSVVVSVTKMPIEKMTSSAKALPVGNTEAAVRAECEQSHLWGPE